MMKSHPEPYLSFVVPPFILLIFLILGSLFSAASAAEGPAPSISKLTIYGELNVGESLSGSYRFNTNAGNAVDKSTFVWGYKGKTASQVANGTMIGSTGYVTPRILVAADIGHVMELSVQAKNGDNIVGNILTLASDSDDQMNTTDGGDGKGRVTDPFLPMVSDLKLSGVLEVNRVLQASYSFSAGQNGSGDQSTFAWGPKGTTAVLAPQGQTVANTGKPTGYTITKNDVGKILEISVLARNALGKTGNTVTLASDATAAAGNSTTGGDGKGHVTDPNAVPTIGTLKLTGKLDVGQSLTASYTFDSKGGNATDKSSYAWGTKGTTAKTVTSGQPVTASGKVPARLLTTADVGKILEVSVLARNALGKTGNTLTLASDATAAAGNSTTGGKSGTVTNTRGTVSTITSSISRTTAKVGETITLNITAKDANGNPAVGVSISVARTSATNRQNSAQTPTLLINGKSSYTSTTNPLSVNLTDPSGKGVRTQLTITSGAATRSQTVTFTVPTSPDTSRANFWGHMQNSVTYNRAIFYRPQLYSENNAYTFVDLNNERWSAISNTIQGNSSCNARAGSGTGGRLVLPQDVRSAGLVTLQDFAATSALKGSGFPTGLLYMGWSGNRVNLSTGAAYGGLATSLYLCQDDGYLYR